MSACTHCMPGWIGVALIPLSRLTKMCEFSQMLITELLQPDNCQLSLLWFRVIDEAGFLSAFCCTLCIYTMLYLVKEGKSTKSTPIICQGP